MPLSQDTAIQNMILSELQALKADHSEFSRATGERLAALEVGMKTIIGNGQKGRLTLLEESVDRLKAFRWYLLGAAASTGGVVSLLFHLGVGK